MGHVAGTKYPPNWCGTSIKVSVHRRGHVDATYPWDLCPQHSQVVIFTPVHVPATCRVGVHNTGFLSVQHDLYCLSSFKAKTMSRTAGTSSENITSCFCWHIAIIQDHLAFIALKNLLSGIKWHERLGEKLEKKSFCFHSQGQKLSTELLNRSFHVFDRTSMAAKCTKNKKCTGKACKTAVF